MPEATFPLDSILFIEGITFLKHEYHLVQNTSSYQTPALLLGDP